MGHLFTPFHKNCKNWSSGFASFLTSHKQGFHRLSVAIRCRIGSMEEIDLALLDTGAEWSVIDGETAGILGDEIGPSSGEINIDTRLGKLRGALHRVDITLLAEEGCGRDLTVNGTVIVSKEWDGPIVLGYRGFMERIRIALDPGFLDDRQVFYFGPVDP